MIIVDTVEKFNEAMDFISQSEFLSYDIETTGLNVRKDTIIGFGISNHYDGFYFPLFTYMPSLNLNVAYGLGRPFIQSILEALSKKKLLMFNAAFDAVFTRNDLGVDLLPALHTDVLLLKHTCDEDFPLALKDIAVKLWGQDVKKEKEEMLSSIKANGGRAKEYYKADSELIATYCVKDCLLTFRLYQHYSKILKREGLEKFYYEEEVLPLYKEVTIPMEEQGVRLDVPAMQQISVSLHNDTNEIESAIQSKISGYLPTFKSWFLNKEYPYKETGRIAKLMKKHSLDMSSAQALAYQDDYNNQHMFNIQSKHHLKKLFFDILKEEPVSKTDKGNPQVDEAFLDKMALKYDWAKELIIFNKLTKLKSTYIDRLLEGAEDGKFYPSFLQHRTVSGRYSGDLQQLPRPIEDESVPLMVRHYTNLIRSFIIPDNGSVLVSADYEQLEPTIFAHTSGDKALQDIFIKGKDFYSEIAIRTEHIPDVSADKEAENYLGKIHKSKRQKAKAYALGIAYGMTGYKLQFELGVPLNEAERLVKDYLDAFPDLARWMSQSKDEVCLYGQIRSQAGRIRHVPRAAALFSAYGSRLGDSLQLWKDYHEDAELYAEAKASYREFKNYLNNAINFQVQSLAASIINRAAIQINRKLKTEGLKTALVMQVHDQLVYNVPKNEIDAITPIIKDYMENTVKLSVPLRVVPVIGEDFGKCK